MTMLDVPDWLSTYIRAWQDRLALGGWRIRVALALCVGNHPDNRALCQQYPDLNQCDLTFRADVEDTPEWRRTAIHELCHVAHARIDHLIERAVIPRLTDEGQALAGEVYHHAVESYIEALAHTLYDASCAIDYPEEYGDKRVE